VGAGSFGHGAAAFGALGGVVVGGVQFGDEFAGLRFVVEQVVFMAGPG